MDIIKTLKPPILFFIWVVLSLSFFIYSALNSTNVIAGLIYTLLLSFFSYLYFLRFSCKIVLYKDKLELIYYPLMNKETVLLTGINKIKIYRGFYSFDGEGHPKNRFKPRICYDSVIIYYKEKENNYVLNVNLMVGQFKILEKHILKKINKL